MTEFVMPSSAKVDENGNVDVRFSDMSMLLMMKTSYGWTNFSHTELDHIIAINGCDNVNDFQSRFRRVRDGFRLNKNGEVLGDVSTVDSRLSLIEE